MYEDKNIITEPIGNNAFSYDERMALWSAWKIYVPSLIQWTIEDVAIGTEIAFEEVVNWKLISCIWLKHFVQLEYHDTPIFIVDNHNHALSFRYWTKWSPPFTERGRYPEGMGDFFTLIHIDQHADTKDNTNSLSQDEDVERFINTQTNVGNFITAAINSWIIDEVIQIRTDYALQEHWNTETMQHWNIILDIDIDFRVDKEPTESDFEIIRNLITKAELVTIATSPYFMEQVRAIEIIKKILQ